MREMKDSGIEWIGEIPNEWNIIKLKNAISIRSGEFIDKDEYIENGEYSIIGSNGEIGKTNKFNNTETVIVTGRVGSVGTAHIIGESWITDNALIIITHNVNTYYKFIYYCIPLFDYTMLLSGTAQPLITATKLRNQSIPLPVFIEQRKTVSYLDTKCAEIDSLVADIQSQIETLEQYKRSVITEAVTKGLDPDVEMRDSGIEFIGKVPKHWEIRRMKILGTVRNGLTYTPQDICDENEGTLVLRSSNVQNGKISLNDNVYVSCDIKSDLMVKYGDILICSRNGSKELIGKNAIIKNLNATFGAFMMIFRSESPEYLYYVLNSHVFSYYLGTFFTSTINQLTGFNFGNMKVAFCPNVCEQQKIVEYLDKKCIEIDGIITEKKQQLETIEKYKKSLIFEYVTGKKEVVL